MIVTITADPRLISNPTTLGGMLAFIGFGPLSGASAIATVTLNVGTGPVGGGFGALIWNGPVSRSCQVNFSNFTPSP